MTVKEIRAAIKNGDKVKSPTCPLTQGDDFIAKRDVIMGNGNTANKLAVVSVVDGVETASNLTKKEIKDYEDWVVV